MAKAYAEGKGWAFRLRICGQDIYRSGFRTEAAASPFPAMHSNACRSSRAATKMANVTTHQVQTLIDAMVSEGYGPATIDHKRAELRRQLSDVATTDLCRICFICRKSVTGNRRALSDASGFAD